MHPPAAAPSVARGLAVLAVVAACYVAGRALLGVTAAATDGTVQPLCVKPVEVLQDDGVHLGCATEPVFRACSAIQAGDSVRIDRRGCVVEPHGMRQATRLVVGLKLDVNRATAAELELLDGIGPTLSQAIVAERSTGGPFASLDDLRRVRGIGPRTVAVLRGQTTALAGGSETDTQPLSAR